MAHEIKLPSDISELAEQAVANGHFRSVEDVLRAGVKAVTALDVEETHFSDAEREATEQLLLERLNDEQPLKPYDGDAFLESVRQGRAASRLNR